VISEGNAEAVRESVAAFNRGDLDAGLEIYDAYGVVRFDHKWPENRPRFGKKELRSYFEDVILTLGARDSVIEELIEAGDRVVVRFRTQFRGRGSGVQDDTVFTQLLTFRRGKVIELEYFLNFNEALEAVGLSE
jgi:ketosteroid isomerase-like protein